MPAQIVISRGNGSADAEQVDTTWARQWAKQLRRIQKLLAYRRLAFKSITLSKASSADWLRRAKATTTAPGFGRLGSLERAGKILNEKRTTVMAMPTSTLVGIQGYLQRSIATEVRRVKATRRSEFRKKLFGDAQQGFSLHHKMTKPEQPPPVTQVVYEEEATLSNKAEANFGCSARR